MYLKSLFLQNFRNYKKSEFSFSPDVTLVVGPNTSGKTNLLESIYLLAHGGSFRTNHEQEMIGWGEEIGRVKGEQAGSPADVTDLEIILTSGFVQNQKVPLKKYLVNGVVKRRVDFIGNQLCVLFSPVDLEIIVDSPSRRRDFLDFLLEQVDKEYRFAIMVYTKALRQRNALLQEAQRIGFRNEKQFEYWDNLLIKNGEIITQKRESFIEFLNKSQKEIFDFATVYDKSIISEARLLQYKEAEIGAGVTLVGPHRDDINFQMFNNTRRITHDIKLFGSRGQQRLTLLQLKLLEVSFIEKKTDQRPILLLDDIFSELDKKHINLVLERLGEQQTIITTTHKEFIGNSKLKGMDVIELG